MKPPASPLPLVELLQKSRDLRIRLTMHSDHADRLKKSVEKARLRMPRKSLFSPE